MLENIRLRALALRSSIHNEHTLSAIEMTAMCAKKTNELIDVVNDLTKYIDELQNTNFSLRYDDENEELLLGTEVG